MIKFGNYIVATNEDSERKYLILATKKPQFRKWVDDFGSNGENEDDHLAKMDKNLINSEDSLELIVAELQELRQKLTPRKRLRKRSR